MLISELIKKLTFFKDTLGDLPVYILTSFEDEDGEDRNCEYNIDYVDSMFNQYVYISFEED